MDEHGVVRTGSLSTWGMLYVLAYEVVQSNLGMLEVSTRCRAQVQQLRPKVVPDNSGMLDVSQLVQSKARALKSQVPALKCQVLLMLVPHLRL